MRDKRRLVFVLSFVVALLLVVSSGTTLAADKYGGMKKLELATASQGGGFFSLGTALTPVLERSLGIPVVATTSKGSNENIALTERGEIWLSMITGSMLYEAWGGTKFFKKKHRNGRILLAFYPSNAFLFTRADSGITKMSQLAGKRVGIGTNPATWNYFTCPMIEAHNIKCPGDVRPVYSGFRDLATQVGDGTIDAAVALETIPAVYQLAQEKKIRVLEFDDSAIKYLDEKVWNYFASDMKQSEMPKDSWDKPVFKTVMWMGPYLVARKDMPDDLAYDIVKATHQNLEELNKANKLFRWAYANNKVLTTPLVDMDWHPAAEKYWREVGLWQGKKPKP